MKFSELLNGKVYQEKEKQGEVRTSPGKIVPVYVLKAVHPVPSPLATAIERLGEWQAALERKFALQAAEDQMSSNSKINAPATSRSHLLSVLRPDTKRQAEDGARRYVGYVKRLREQLREKIQWYRDPCKGGRWMEAELVTKEEGSSTDIEYADRIDKGKEKHTLQKDGVKHLRKTIRESMIMLGGTIPEDQERAFRPMHPLCCPVLPNFRHPDRVTELEKMQIPNVQQRAALARVVAPTAAIGQPLQASDRVVQAGPRPTAQERPAAAGCTTSSHSRAVDAGRREEVLQGRNLLLADSSTAASSSTASSSSPFLPFSQHPSFATAGFQRGLQPGGAPYITFQPPPRPSQVSSASTGASRMAGGAPLASSTSEQVGEENGVKAAALSLRSIANPGADAAAPQTIGKAELEMW
ncbi:unnamed protein product [Amoebophrya sp. A120]|nr:unnamed protein product [Amoebophrya sp. A120]|eukprot:GSA120T00017881001.1